MREQWTVTEYDRTEPGQADAESGFLTIHYADDEPRAGAIVRRLMGGEAREATQMIVKEFYCTGPDGVERLIHYAKWARDPRGAGGWSEAY